MSYPSNIVEFFSRDSTELSSPLIFDGYDSPRKILNSTDVNMMVLRVLKLSVNHNSATVTLPFIEQTHKNKRRSAFDIWRHIIYYYPEIKITQVMSSLYDLCSSGLISTQYCNEIERRVFIIFDLNYLRDSNIVDEFQYTFEEWRDIETKIKPSVVLIASGYEWTCPKCQDYLWEVEITETVTCSNCKRTFEVSDFVHAMEG